jgi:hypothetical protein
LWIRAVYLKEETIRQLHDSFYKQPRLAHLQLHHFLAQHTALTLLYSLKKAPATFAVIPDRHSLQLITLTKEMQLFLTFLTSPLFLNYLQQLTHLQLTGLPEIQLLRFGKGNYTLLHDQDVRRNALVVTFELTAHWDPSFGGYDAYLEAAEEPLLLFPHMNTVSLVHLTEKTQYFSKYVNHLAGNHLRHCIRVLYPAKKS